MISRASQKIIVSKWLDKRDVLFLSTKHRPDFCRVEVNRYDDKVFLKPTAIVDYNNAKTFYITMIFTYTVPCTNS